MHWTSKENNKFQKWNRNPIIKECHLTRPFQWYYILLSWNCLNDACLQNFLNAKFFFLWFYRKWCLGSWLQWLLYCRLDCPSPGSLLSPVHRGAPSYHSALLRPFISQYFTTPLHTTVLYYAPSYHSAILRPFIPQSFTTPLYTTVLYYAPLYHSSLLRPFIPQCFTTPLLTTELYYAPSYHSALLRPLYHSATPLPFKPQCYTKVLHPSSP